MGWREHRLWNHADLGSNLSWVIFLTPGFLVSKIQAIIHIFQAACEDLLK